MIKVTDHAVLRYLQRVEGVDIEGVRQMYQHETPPCVPMDSSS